MAKKPWRKYFWYRPTLPPVRLSDDMIRRQEREYINWLAKVRGLSLYDAEKHARSGSYWGVDLVAAKVDGQEPRVAVAYGYVVSINGQLAKLFKSRHAAQIFAERQSIEIAASLAA